MTTPLLRIHDLHAGYGRAEVLHGIDLEAGEGSVVTVIGPNGAGKSTLLNALMGVLPAEGNISTGVSRSADSRWKSASCSASPSCRKRELFGTMPVEDNLWCSAPFARCACAIRSGASRSNRCTRSFRDSRSDAPNSRERCRAAKGKCSPSAAR